MNSTRIISVILVAVAVGLVAWGFSFIPATEPAGPMEQILPGQLSEEGNYHYAENADYYTVDADYPATTSLSGAADVRARATIERAVADRVAEFKRNGDFDNLTAEDVRIQGLGPDRKYALGMEYQAYAGANTISYLYRIYEDTLGAHPNGYFMTFVFDRGGAQVRLGDLFKPGADYLGRLSQAATAQVRQQVSERLGSDAVPAIFDEGLRPTEENFRNFVIDGNILRIFFPPYQVAPYAAGTFEVSVPLSGLSDILAPDVL